jgi:uncharacterized protein YbaP (TraB family)
MNKILLFLGLSAVFIAGIGSKKASSETNEDALLWKISGKGLEKPSYLFGTFHIMCKEDIILTSTLENALAGSDEVWMEVDLTDTLKMMQSMGKMMMKDGKKLSDFLTNEEYKAVETKLKEAGFGLASLERFQPTLIAAMLIPGWFDCKERSGVDAEILALTKKHKKKLNGFENFGQQLELFSALPYDKQARELYKTVSDDGEKAKMLKGYQDYKNQKLSEVTKMISEDESAYSNEFKEILLKNRNHDWVNQLKTILPAKSVFIAVGVGHLLDDEGLIPLLRKQGYTVTPVKQ